MKLSPKRKTNRILFLLTLFGSGLIGCHPEKSPDSKASLNSERSDSIEIRNDSLNEKQTLDVLEPRKEEGASVSSFAERRNESENQSKSEPIPSSQKRKSYVPTATEQDIRQGTAVIEKYHPLDDPDPTPDPAPDEFVPVDSDPILLNWEELKREIQKPPHLTDVKGTVYLKVLISRNGFYRGHLIRRSPHPDLTVEVVKAVKQLRAKPATYQGKPVKVWINLSYEFQ